MMQYACKVHGCGKVFDKPFGLSMHMVRKHGGKAEPKTSALSAVALDSTTALRSHIEQITGRMADLQLQLKKAEELHNELSHLEREKEIINRAIHDLEKNHQHTCDAATD